MTNTNANFISLNALERDFLSLGQTIANDLECLLFMEKRSGRGVAVVSAENDVQCKIVSEILFSKRTNSFSTRFDDERFAAACINTLWEKMASRSSEIKIGDFSSLFERESPCSFVPKVSLANFNRFLGRREKYNSFEWKADDLVRSVDYTFTVHYLAAALPKVSPKALHQPGLGFGHLMRICHDKAQTVSSEFPTVFNASSEEIVMAAERNSSYATC